MSTPPGQQPPGPPPNPYGDQPPYGGTPPHGQQPYGAPPPYGAQPPYGGQPYISPYGGDGGGRKRSPVPWIIGGLVVVAGGVGAVLFFFFGESKDDTSSPRAVVESLAAAIEDGDADAISNLLCQGDRDIGRDAEIAELAGGGGELSDFEITGEEKDGDVTYVMVDGSDGTTRIPVVEEDGEYLICATARPQNSSGQ